MTPANDSPTPSSLPRTLGVFGLWLLVLNGMIGAGIFGIPAEGARLAAGWSPWLFLATAVLIAPVMLCFAALSSATLESGGPARYVQIAFGRQAGFQAGWAMYIARMTAFAANLNLLLAALAYFIPGVAEGAGRMLALAALVTLLALLNIIGVRRAMQSLAALTAGKLLPLLALAVLGLFALPDAGQPPPLPALGEVSFGAALLLMIYAYVGFESGLIPGGEARAPQRDMPRALLASLAVCAVLYAVLQWACIALLPNLPETQRPLVALGQQLLGPFGATLILAAIVMSVGGNLLGSMFSVPRITHAFAEQRLVPGVFGVVSGRFRTPWFSVLAYAFLCWALAASGSFVWLASLSVLTRLLIYLGCIAAMPAVARQAPADAWRLSGGPVVPVLAALFCIGLLTQVSLQSVLATAALLAAGTVLYWLARRG
ncbi:APC family permease [Pseudomarimonas salicorniae]|uniref:Arginine/agmatine antiporter n=1 Tax=Pseudomarimonas salicorniae TaxID=2933270 RepID=A0ABT0GFK5_9GAMM|nr:APC family permease [Lysobacter sp. CAU 1642]MCK7593313.1 APC family permease [Lysobacter sp. CAU 1642]